jgi:hypothetical protein
MEESHPITGFWTVDYTLDGQPWSLVGVRARDEFDVMKAIFRKHGMTRHA